ncbi:Nudix hydrolase 12 mitochondrial [Bienertia sinuspersici]
MVSSPSCHVLVIPKGGWENDETIHEATCREAFEEASFRGNINVRLNLNHHYLSPLLSTLQ